MSFHARTTAWNAYFLCVVCSRKNNNTRDTIPLADPIEFSVDPEGKVAEQSKNLAIVSLALAALGCVVAVGPVTFLFLNYSSSKTELPGVTIRNICAVFPCALCVCVCVWVSFCVCLPKRQTFCTVIADDVKRCRKTVWKPISFSLWWEIRVWREAVHSTRCARIMCRLWNKLLLFFFFWNKKKKLSISCVCVECCHCSVMESSSRVDLLVSSSDDVADASWDDFYG